MQIGIGKPEQLLLQALGGDRRESEGYAVDG